MFSQDINYFHPLEQNIGISSQTLRQSGQQQLLDAGHELWHAQLQAIDMVPDTIHDRRQPDFYLHEIAAERLSYDKLRAYFGRSTSYEVERRSKAYQQLIWSQMSFNCPDY